MLAWTFTLIPAQGHTKEKRNLKAHDLFCMYSGRQEGFGFWSLTARKGAWSQHMARVLRGAIQNDAKSQALEKKDDFLCKFYHLPIITWSPFLPPNKSRDTKFLLPWIWLAGRTFSACAIVGVCVLGFTETLTSSVTAHPEPNTRLTVVSFWRLFFFKAFKWILALLHAKRLQLYLKCICSNRFARW